MQVLKFYFVLTSPTTILKPPIHILVQIKESDAENHAILSHAVSEEGCTYLGPIVKPDDKVSDATLCSILTCWILYFCLVC